MPCIDSQVGRQKRPSALANTDIKNTDASPVLRTRVDSVDITFLSFFIRY
jgi:hypothetical protein